jgi:hypothetical protein
MFSDRVRTRSSHAASILLMMPITAATNSWVRLARTAPVQPAVDQDARLLRDGEGDQAFIDLDL